MFTTSVISFEETINLEFKESLPPFYQNRLKAIQEHNFSKMKFKFREELCSKGLPYDDDYIDRGIMALQQYYAVAALDPLNMHAISKEVDPFWHVHMLFSKDYTELSVKIFGQYMHHDPLDHDNFEKLEFVRKLYHYTLEVYQKMFNTYDEEMYPSIVSDADLVCPHYNYTGEEEIVSVFPLNMELAVHYDSYN